jgi:hypothetical protein
MKRHCTAAGLDAAPSGGHSLRAGLITSAMEGGAQEHRTMQHSRHKSGTRVPHLRAGPEPARRYRPARGGGGLMGACTACSFDRRHFCGTGTDLKPATFDTPVGAFQVGCCWQCAEQPPTLSWRDAVRLVLDHPADDS